MATGLFNLKQVNQAISQGAWSGYIAPKWVEYLVVAGGGGGGSSNGGGGGAGGLLTGIVTVATGTSYTVTVGSGGNGGSYISALPGYQGSNSVFGNMTATGGGGGGTENNSTPASSGGSGGGANYVQSSGTVFGQGISGQGNAGGRAVAGAISPYPAGGGGGAGTVGLNAVTPVSGNGGAGIASAITGTVVAYAGGGGGGCFSGSGGVAGSGGVGGGGAGSTGVATNGSANTGGGGGGSGNSTNSAGTGGSGIVVIRYPGNVQFFTGGTVNYNNGYIIHIFTSSGTLAPTTPTPYNTSYQISRSLRFNSDDSAYLNRTPASAGNRKTWTFSAWVKRGSVSTNQYFISNLDTGGASGLGVQFASDGTLNIFDYGSSSYVYQLQTTAVFRDPSAWYHFVIAFDTTQATSSNRVKLYVNNVQQTSFSISSYPTLNYDGYWNNTSLATISRAGGLSTQYFNGYVTETNFIDGQALTPSSFGATSTTNGVWAPIQYTGTYGTNGFYLNFSDNSNTTAATLGKDYSGNGNNWTPNNFSVTAGAGNDSLVDSPTSYGTDTGVGGTVRGNYCTWNAVDNLELTLRNGNLDASFGVAAWRSARSTIGMSSGKWYCEITMTTVDNIIIGLMTSQAALNNNAGQDAYGWGYYSANGNKKTNGTLSAYGASYTNGDIIGIAFDADSGTLTFYKNNTSQGTAFTGLTSGPYMFAVSLYGTCATTVNFGQRPFAYTAPSGFKALCTQNLPTPTIGATSNALATQFFNPVLYTGNGTTQTVTNSGFQPDWVWIKTRNAVNSNATTDSVRGITKINYTNSTQAEDTASNCITSLNSNGFSLGNNAALNNSGTTYVAWNWRAGNNAGSSNGAGSIASTVSVNTTSGFSVVTYTGSITNGTVGHGLGTTPSMIIAKSRSDGTGSWVVYHTSLGANQVIVLNSTGTASTQSGYWGTPSSTTFGVATSGSSSNNLGNMVAYCFAPVSGFSAFGFYTGNGSTDGPFVFTGMRPSYVMVKRTDGNSNWVVEDTTRDTYNVASKVLYPSSNAAEDATWGFVDILSNGFKIRNSDAWLNGTGGTYIFACFAENPFKYSLAR